MLHHPVKNSWWLLLTVILLGSFFSCTDENELSNIPEVFFCDVEMFTSSDNSTVLVDSSGFEFMGSEQRSTARAYSGKYSLLLDSLNEFGFGMELMGVRPGEVFTIEVWQNVIGDSKPCALVAANEGNSFYHSANTVIREDGQWKLVQTHLYIPKDFEGAKLSFYIWNKGTIKAYVDDFRVIRYNHQTDHEAFELEKIFINVDEAGLKRLEEIRDSAMSIGILKRGESDYVPVQITYKDQNRKGKIRLKGDWVDHLRGDKWSFRIKLKKKFKDGVKTFSVQAPHTRDFLNEYLYHHILWKEDILSPEYRFVQLYLNNVSLGIYAFEEHLSSRIMDRGSKPRGVILKLDDKPYWEAISEMGEDGIEGNSIAKADIKVYGKAKKRKAHRDKVNAAKKIMEDYKKLYTTVYESFDTQQMAKYYALCDLTRAYHAMVWINIRFYYNFTSKMMEPIGYDAYTEAGPKLFGSPYLGYAAKHHKYSRFESKAIVFNALHNPAIAEHYRLFLDEFTDSLYIQKIMDEMETDLNFFESQIRIEYPHYSFDEMFLFNNARAIRSALIFQRKELCYRYLNNRF